MYPFHFLTQTLIKFSYPVHLPWWGLLLALGITTVMFLPVAIIMAITNQHSSLYLICQLVCGVVFPGRPVANMVFVTYCYISSAQGIKFSSDLKLGHYMKIPPKLLFTVQIVATLVSSVTQVGVLNWMFVNVQGICTPEAVNGFNCPIARVHFNGSILWGLIGPQRFFGGGALYRHLIWAFLVGVIAPPAIWLLWRRTRLNFLRKISLPVLFGSLAWIPPAVSVSCICNKYRRLIILCRLASTSPFGLWSVSFSTMLSAGALPPGGVNIQ
jgi:OPT family oligopeptide transporter